MAETPPATPSQASQDPGLIDPAVVAPGAAKRILGRLLGRDNAPNIDSSSGDALSELDGSIPSVLDDFSDNGEYYQRPKESQPATVRHNMQATFNGYQEQQQELATATDKLFRDLTTQPNVNTTPMARIDRLLAGYPNNIVGKLRGAASGDSLLAVIRTGGTLLDMIDKRGDSPTAITAINNNKGAVAELLADKIPRLVAAEGVTVLERIQAIAAEKGILSVNSFIDFKLKYGNNMPEPTLNPEATIGDSVPDSPFTREDADQAWEQGPNMGIERRPAMWGDLAQMAAITDQWGREYGLSINRGNDGNIGLAFIRSQGVAISNRTSMGELQGETVFFHSHPQEETVNGLLAPLVSLGDVLATTVDDSGGAYFNVVSRNGITLQVASQPVESNDPPGWTVESGDLRSTTISSDGGTTGQNTTEVMQQLLGTGMPFAYSINTTGMVRGHDRSRKIFFVHIPWGQLATNNTTLNEVCFGDGLRKILPDDIGGSDSNLSTAIQKAKYGE